MVTWNLICMKISLFFSSVMTEKQTHQQTSRETQMMTIKNHSCLCSGKNLWLKFQWNFICNFMLFEISNKPILEVWKLCETLWNFVKFYHWNFNKFHWNFILFQIVWNFRTLCRSSHYHPATRDIDEITHIYIYICWSIPLNTNETKSDFQCQSHWGFKPGLQPFQKGYPKK